MDLYCPSISTWEHPREVSVLRLHDQPVKSEAGDMSDGHAEVPAPNYDCCKDSWVMDS